MHIHGVGVCVCERERERERKEGERVRQVGQVLAYLTSMDVNLCFSDLHKLWHRYIKTILLPFQLVRLTLIPGLHYSPDTEVRYLPHTSLQ